jgi:hypothetical protein
MAEDYRARASWTSPRIPATVVCMRGLLVSVVALAVVLAPGLGDKKPKPPVEGKVPWGMCSVVDVVVKSKQHPCPGD